MIYPQKHLTRQARALLAAGACFHRKDAGNDDDPFAALTKAFGTHTEEVLRRLGGTDQDVAAIKEQLAEIEQRAARGSFGGSNHHFESWGAQVADAPEIKALADGGERGKARILVKALTSDMASAGALAPPDRQRNITLLPKRRLTVRDLLGIGQTSSNSVEFMKQSGFTNSAAPVAEGALKPESQITFELADAKVKTIATWIKASRQILADAPLLRSTVDGELTYAIAFVEEGQLLHGDGTGQNLHGIIPQATAYETTRNQAGDTRFDTILHAIEQAEIADLPASGVILPTSDWFAMVGTKGDDGHYLSGLGPLANVPPRLWQLPVVWTNCLAAGDFVVGAFESAVTLFDRQQTTIEVGHVNDDFIRNLLTILAEERVALAVKRPEAIIHGSFPTA
ncbi:phage major capsid protein [Sinorhizobium fredii]|uniref:Phage capsid family protein n=1 Tax=Rhizobium fredii TaxID=380 RepID=A0A2L0H927_RHIFR|nr:phage major capsid protein [Sinorhizobium fredii]AUX77991.1 phage capsid family protein [Sinorhizobium fredii]